MKRKQFGIPENSCKVKMPKVKLPKSEFDSNKIEITKKWTPESVLKELKPCLHCGKIPVVYHKDYVGDTYIGDTFLIECQCGIGSVDFDIAEKIITDWNRQFIIKK
jgi:hypothetical protein